MILSIMWLCRPMILALGRLSRGITASLRPLEIHSKFKASLGYCVNSRKKGRKRRRDGGMEGWREDWRDRGEGME